VTEAATRTGFWSALLLVASGETALHAFTVPDRGRHTTDRVLAEVARGLPRRPILFWADSVSAGALRGTDEEPFVTDVASTRATAMAGAYFTLRRQVERAGAPDAVVLCLAPFSPLDELDTGYERTYFDDLYTDPAEIAEHLELTGRRAQALRMAMNAFLVPPSARRNGAPPRWLRALRGRPEPVEPPPSRPAPDRAERMHAYFERATVGLPDLTARYLKRLGAYAAERGFRVVVLRAPVPASVERAWAARDVERPRREALAALAARVPALEVREWDAGEWPDEQFHDHSHLFPEPRAAYGRRLAAEIRRIRGEGAAPR
jgi:hypothetical protein